MASMRVPSRLAATGRSSSCTVQRYNGDFCDAPGADDMPFPICTRHALELYRHLRDVLAEATETSFHRATVVYYVLIGDMIKIGATDSLARRIGSYPPGAVLLAQEPGNRLTERLRHEQFASHRTARREWYRIEQPIIDHINEIRISNGDTPLTLTDLRSPV